MSKLNFLLVLLSIFFMSSCSSDDSDDCQICKLNDIETEICKWEENSVTSGRPGATAAQIIENTTVLEEVQVLKDLGYSCN